MGKKVTWETPNVHKDVLYRHKNQLYLDSAKCSEDRPRNLHATKR